MTMGVEEGYERTSEREGWPVVKDIVSDQGRYLEYV